MVHKATVSKWKEEIVVLREEEQKGKEFINSLLNQLNRLRGGKGEKKEKE